MARNDLPRADEAERAVLGCLLTHRDVILFVSPLLRPADFYDSRRRAIYEAALALLERQVPCDLATLAGELEARGQLDEVGGPAALGALVDAAPVPVHAEYYATQVAHAARARRYLGTLATLGSLAYTAGDPFAQALKTLREEQGVASGGAVESKAVASALLEEMRVDRQAPRPRFGVPSLDARIMLRPGAFLILAGRPGVGKTALAEMLADHNAQDGRQVLFATLEMPPDDLYRRRLCRLAGLGWDDACELALLSEDGKARVAGRLGEVEAWPGAVAFLPGPFDAEALRAEALRRQAGSSLDLVVVDYVQIMDAGGKSLVEQNTNISKGLKRLAMELRVPLVAVSQLNRLHGEGERPTLRSLRESGQYEQDAHTVVFLWNELDAKGQKATSAGFDIVNWAIAKNRNGPLGEGTLFFDGPRFRFKE